MTEDIKKLSVKCICTDNAGHSFTFLNKKRGTVARNGDKTECHDNVPKPEIGTSENIHSLHEVTKLFVEGIVLYNYK